MTAEPESVPIEAKRIGRPPSAILDEHAKSVLRERWDGSTATADELAEELGVLRWRILDWARLLGLRNLIQPNGKTTTKRAEKSQPVDPEPEPTIEPEPELATIVELAPIPTPTTITYSEWFAAQSPGAFLVGDCLIVRDSWGADLLRIYASGPLKPPQGPIEPVWVEYFLRLITGHRDSYIPGIVFSAEPTSEGMGA